VGRIEKVGLVHAADDIAERRDAVAQSPLVFVE
jgi:hypothetical protein